MNSSSASSPYNNNASTDEVFDQHPHPHSHPHPHHVYYGHPPVIAKIHPDISFDRGLTTSSIHTSGSNILINNNNNNNNNHPHSTIRSSSIGSIHNHNHNHNTNTNRNRNRSFAVVPATTTTNDDTNTTTTTTTSKTNTNTNTITNTHESKGTSNTTTSNSNNNSSNNNNSNNKKNNHKRDGHNLRKAPGAPKRFKSSYIMFFMAKQKEIKAELGEGASVGEISKKSSEKWRNLPKEERAIWDAKAEEDKERYNREKEKYTGPWQVPWKRAKKNPKAPKRPMSAFLFFSQERRRSIKEAHPDMRNTEISRVLGGMWKKATPEEKAPHIEREAAEREKYKIEIAKWRKEEEIRSRMAAERAEAKWEAKKALEESQVQSSHGQSHGLNHHLLHQDQNENRDCSSNLNRKSPPISQRDSPLPLSHQPRPSSSPIPIQSYYSQASYGDYYPVQPYSALPQYNSYNPYPAAPAALPPPQSQQPHHVQVQVQNQAYYRSNNYPPAPPHPHPDYHPTSRHAQEYPPAPTIGRSDSVDSSAGHHHNQNHNHNQLISRSHNTLSPAPVGIPPQYGSFTHFPPSALHHLQGYNNVDQRPPSGSNPNRNYPEEYPAAPPS